MTASFQDHFGSVAGAYAAARPTYPAMLFEWLAGQCAHHDHVWDCATGSGQAAVALAGHFVRVTATDASADQIAAAKPDAHITYRVASAEASGLDDASVDLVTIAQALHWFDLDRFYAEVRRVLKPEGVITAWTYGVQRADDVAIDGVVQKFYGETLGPYWPHERAIVERGYRDLPFPFTRIATPTFVMQRQWSLDLLLAYFASWSAVARYKTARGHDPVTELRPVLAAVWGEPALVRTITWPLTVIAGRV